jgi:hypothetical protein
MMSGGRGKTKQEIYRQSRAGERQSETLVTTVIQGSSYSVLRIFFMKQK